MNRCLGMMNGEGFLIFIGLIVHCVGSYLVFCDLFRGIIKVEISFTAFEAT